jgi:8-oxo-dGTP pyrophosphatase MutT (NUDIX family)
MPKVYAIIRDDHDILVGRGGNVGNPAVARTGLHLPGGTYGWGGNSITAALREISEETGLVLLPQDALHTFTLTLTHRQVTFVVFEVFSVANEIAQRAAPPVVNAHDEPFAHVETLPITNCHANAGFGAAHGTDWFAAGLHHARANGYI